MKNLMITLVTAALWTVASVNASATVTKNTVKETKAAAPIIAEPATISAKTETMPTSMKNNFYISVNFVDLTSGSPNLNADLFTSENMAANFSIRTNSNREDVKTPGNPNEKQKLTVERMSYIIGASFFPMGLQNKFNLMLTPGLAFGTKKSSLDVENQTGISMKASGLMKANNKLAIELGLRGDNLEDNSFTTNLYAGFGLLF